MEITQSISLPKCGESGSDIQEVSAEDVSLPSTPRRSADLTCVFVKILSSNPIMKR